MFLLSLSFKKVVPLAIALELIELAKFDKKFLEILLSKTISNLSLLIFFGFNLSIAFFAAFEPICSGLRR